MICKHCGKEIADDVKFCNYCGKRADGQKACPSCGALLPEDSMFCSSCGANLKGASEVKKEAAVADASAAPAKSVGWKKVLTYVSWGCVAFAAVMALIFTFCIGASAKVAGVGATVSIYDYFGKTYEQLNSLPKRADAFTVIRAYVPVVLGTVISAGAIISIVICAIVTAVKSVNKFVHKKESDWTKPAIGAYISFAAFATAFVALNAVCVESYGVKVGVKFSDATLAGLILGGIALGAYFVCKAVVYFAENKSLKAIVKSSVMLGGGLLFIITVGLSALPTVGLKTSDTYGTESSYGFMEFIQTISKTDSQVTILCCSIVGFIVQLVALAFTVLTVASAAKFITEGKSGTVFPFAITSTALSAVTLAMAIVVGEVYVKDLGSTTYAGSYGAPIAVLVLSVAALAAVIVAVCLFRKNGSVQEQNQ